MTASRVRGSQRIRCTGERGKERLQGFVALTEDWHAKMCLIGVSLINIHPVFLHYYALYRSFGNDCTVALHGWMLGRCTI